ncbi:MAG TPA: ABC transporter substrate-binding protein [Candidatus Binatia bacterium]|jgi:NitT/TauT family transport system substrate-binding protein
MARRLRWTAFLAPLRRFRRQAPRRASILAVAAAVLLSCNPEASPPLRVGICPRVPAELAFIARDLGFFADHDVELVQYSSPIELARHLREGSLDAAALTLDFVPYLAASIPSLDVVFVLGVSKGADGIVAGAEIGDLAGLRGKRIGLEASPLGAHLLLRALKAGGLSQRDVEAVSVDGEDQADAFLTHQVDAVVTADPDRRRLLSSGATSLFDSSRTPGEIVDVLLVPGTTVATQDKALRKLLDGWLAAFTRLDDDHVPTVAKLASGLWVDSAAIEQALAGTRLGDLALNHEMLAGPRPKLASVLEDTEALAVEAGLLRPDHRESVRFDDSFLPGVVSRPLGQSGGGTP